MKRVFPTSSDVIHLFAQRSQNDARCGNVYFDDKDKIYSYGRHYLLGHFLDDKTILINDSGYSVTTSKHISEIRYATRQYKQFFTTKTDLCSVRTQIESLYKRLPTARKKEMYISQIVNLNKSLLEFYTYKREVTKLKKNKDYKAILKIVKSVNSVDLTKHLKALKDKLNTKIKKQIKEFYNYEVDSLRIGNTQDYVRLSECKTKVETSQGIKVSLPDAMLLVRAINNDSVIEGHKINYYTVTSYIKGVLKIGCHTINKKSRERLMKQLQKI